MWAIPLYWTYLYIEDWSSATDKYVNGTELNRAQMIRPWPFTYQLREYIYFELSKNKISFTKRTLPKNHLWLKIQKAIA